MATTSPNNIWTPDSGDDYALTTDLAAMADTIQDAFNDFAVALSTVNDRTLDSGWIALGSFNSGWSQVGGTVTPGLRVKNGWLQLRGRISFSGSGSVNPFSAPLPATARPNYQYDTLVHTSSGEGRNAGISSAGVISIQVGSATSDIYLNSFGAILVG